MDRTNRTKRRAFLTQDRHRLPEPLPEELRHFRPQTQGCAGCRYWRTTKGDRGAWACHFSLDTGRTRLRRGDHGRLLPPETPCPHRQPDDGGPSVGQTLYRRELLWIFGKEEDQP